jgi:hypothetical protein
MTTKRYQLADDDERFDMEQMTADEWDWIIEPMRGNQPLTADQIFARLAFEVPERWLFDEGLAELVEHRLVEVI